MNEIAISNIVSAIIAKEDVMIGADNEKGVYVHIKKADELSANYRSTITLNDLIKLVEKSFEEK
ncbi:hypothetical protein [Peribacillus simplex]|uniref:hypothetical protein n=1 Tax=Peribacillus simplex TaxID=1478 RepID=UPI0024C1A92C|nr:hypothetical protein [Peribacillus simplex]WHX92026.1 hypothetical protein QNH50_03850 [Peribacillus simplex]